MSNQENFWILFSKKLSSEATPEELHELEGLINDHPEWQYAIQNLEDLWKLKPVKDFSYEEDAYLLHTHRMKELSIPFGGLPEKVPMKVKTKQFKWYWAAAAILIVIGLIFFSNFFKSENKNTALARQVNEISTRPGSKSRVELPDGSIVWLNAGSKLTYNKDFGKVKREVTLNGEGFFEVMKNNEKPFVISTSSINIKVLGTVFNVKAYQDDKQTETSLIHGSIEVTIKNRPSDKIILSPSEKLIVENNINDLDARNNNKADYKIDRTQIPDINTLISINKLLYNPNDSTVAETLWVENKLVFRDETFKELAKKMERWYNVFIEIEDNRIAQERLNGTLETETITQALEALKETTPFQYEQNGNHIIIHR